MYVKSNDNDGDDAAADGDDMGKYLTRIIYYTNPLTHTCKSNRTYIGAFNCS